MKSDYSKKGYKIALIALVFAFIAIASATGIQYLESVYCLNCTLDNPTFVNYTFPSSGGNVTQSDMDTKVNKSGDVMTGTLSGYPGGGITNTFSMQGNPWNMCSTDTATTSCIGIYPDFFEMYVTDGSSSGVSITDTAITLTSPNTYIDSPLTLLGTYGASGINMGGYNISNCGNCNDTANRKVNKSGDVMTGKLNISYSAGSDPAFLITNTGASGAGAGSGFVIGEDDGAAMGNGDRLGYNVFFGAVDAAHTLVNSAAISAYTAYAWSSTNANTQLAFATTSNGSTTRVNRFYMTGSGNLSLISDGKGICLDSPNGAHWYITVDNAGALTTVSSATGCT